MDSRIFSDVTSSGNGRSDGERHCPSSHSGPRGFHGQRFDRWTRSGATFVSALLSLTLVACGSGGSGELPPNQLDQLLEISMHDDIQGTAVNVSGRRPTADVPPQQDWYEAILTGNASWSTHERPGGCAILEDDPSGRTLRCMNPFDNTYSGSPFDGDELVFFHPLYIDTPADAELHVEVAYGATETDRNPSDNLASVSISHLENPPAAFEVEAPIAILTHPDEPATLRIRLTQAANAFPRDAQLVVELPVQLVVTAAQAVRRDEQARGEDTVVDCDMTETVVSRQEITG